MKNEQQQIVSSYMVPAKGAGSWRGLVVMSVLLVLAFSVPLYELARFAEASDLYSYIFLIPFISGYLAWLQRSQWKPFTGPARFPAAAFFLSGLAVLAIYPLACHGGFHWPQDDFLSLMMTAFVLFFAAGCCWFLGGAQTWQLSFPISLLVFLIPIPTVLLDGIEAFLQQGSALAAAGFLTLAGATFFRDGLIFKLPTITLQVAPECSGIHSSLVLLITSLVAGQLFLRSRWKRTILVSAVIPLALLRNGFRVFVLGELCTHIGPEMIDSPVHHQGGPLFFALSLIPFFLLLLFLWKSERLTKPSESKPNLKI